MESPTHEPDWNRSNKGSSRRKSANHPPIQRSGSKLEVLPPEDFETILCPTNSAVQTLVDSEVSPRLIQSAGSDGRRSRTGELRSSTPPIQRSSSEGRLTPGQGDHTPRKQIVLPTVKRNFEKHGLPIDGIISINSIEQQKCSNLLHQQGSDKHVQPPGAEGVEMPKAMEMKAEELMSKLKMTEEDGERLEHNRKSKKAAKSENVSGNNAIVDSYYISHTPPLHPSDETLPSSSNSEGSIVQTEPPSATLGEEEKKEDTSSSDESDEEEEKAPFELMGEFLEAVMDEDYENADKLCKMVMMYEPDNSECKQFQPLIEEMLKREREAQLWGSGDSDDEEDDEDDSEDEDNDDEEGSDEDSESSSEESTEESSSESEEETEDTVQVEGQR